MSSQKKLDRDFAEADLKSVSGLLATLRDEDVLARIGLEGRQRELEERIAGLGPIDERTASATLFFGGNPVIGSQGIETEFAGMAITKFQDIVSKVLANDIGGLGQRGIVPNKGASTLHITNIVRGSFGFLFEEARPQQQMVDSSLKAALDETGRLLSALGEPDEERFRTEAESTDQRVLSTAQEFFELMRQSGATMRLVSGETDRAFDSTAVARAAERATSTRVEDTEKSIHGQLAGVLPDAHQFEFRTIERGTIRGRVSRDITPDRLAQFNRELVNREAVGRFAVKRVIRNDDVVRESFTLLELTQNSQDAPEAL
jgi:hypothetical protein